MNIFDQDPKTQNYFDPAQNHSFEWACPLQVITECNPWPACLPISHVPHMGASGPAVSICIVIALLSGFISTTSACANYNLYSQSIELICEHRHGLGIEHCPWELLWGMLDQLPPIVPNFQQNYWQTFVSMNSERILSTVFFIYFFIISDYIYNHFWLKRRIKNSAIHLNLPWSIYWLFILSVCRSRLCNSS